MSQLSLFNSEEFYEFPKDLVEHRENFLPAKEADELKDYLLHTVQWEQRTQKCTIRLCLRHVSQPGMEMQWNLTNQIIIKRKLTPGLRNFCL